MPTQTSFKGVISSLTARSIMFAAFFAVTAFYLALHGLLTQVYVNVIIALQLLIVGRAVASDYHDRAMKAGDATPDDPNPGSPTPSSPTGS